MSPVEPRTVLAKLERIVEEIAFLAGYRGQTFEVYARDPKGRRAAERSLEVIIEAAVDINHHVVVQNGFPPPSDYRSSFGEAARVGLIDPALAAALAPSAGLRHRLAHEYSTIDDCKVFDAISEAVRGYAEYVTQVRAYVRQGKP